jgi:Spy/CpxP family protein refolding chaperone
MKKLILGVMITLSFSTLTGCGNSFTAPGQGFSLRADNASGKFGFMRGGKEMKGGPGGIFGLTADLNLTADQKTQLEALRKENQPAKVAPDKAEMEANRTAMEALRKAINDAFISDNFDATALKAKLDALKPAKPNIDDHINAEANMIIKTFNILTPEQRTTIENKLKEFDNLIPKNIPLPPADFDPAKMADLKITKLATELGLSDAQKTSLKEVLQPVTIEKPDYAAEQAKRKAARDALFTALKAGNATVESIAAILKSNAPEIKIQEGNELDQLAKIHAILNSDQRKKFIDLRIGFGPVGHPGPEGPGFKGFKGGPGGHQEFGGPGRRRK